MNSYCTYALHQIEVAVISIVAIIDRLDEADLLVKPTEGKHSVGDLLKHIAVICRADFHISGEATQEEMSAYYAGVSLNNLKDIQAEILSNYSYLERAFREMTEEELHQKMTSYWGVAYSRYEWLLEIVAHMYHHRGQLHAMLVHCNGKDPGVPLFE
ncbi:damage-inducible protein DinB [Bacillus sp. FJAT-18019]|uniref:Damage-inducible protein DinB n=1 Tax=Paenibacillus solani TaxID=1705565 RepID=A0A0M1N3K1_9BACL|nr:DinB family protein [Paenibacillus solani]KOP65293.1 damage-inducible protein DinB [Bacillus sp. FJAT-18019]KOR76733.1 damage-inducible protein DinB [Paenibacillus solani]